MSENENHIIFQKFNILNKRLIYCTFSKIFLFTGENFNAFIVTNDDKVYCFGGLLGLPQQNSVHEFIINHNLSNNKIIDFNNGLFHVIARTLDAKIFCWGKNKYGCLGNGKSGCTINKPKLNTCLRKINIIDIFCGDKHTIILTDDRQVYSWGSNKFEETGIGRENIIIFVPKLLNSFNGKKVKAISCG